LILPLFNKLTSACEGEIERGDFALCEICKFPLDNIFIMNGNNNIFQGQCRFSLFLGKPQEKVVSFDTLLEAAYADNCGGWLEWHYQ